MYKVLAAVFVALLGTVCFAQDIFPEDTPKGELLRLDWPDEEGWKLGQCQENEKMLMCELLRDDETFENWTELGTMTVHKSVRGRDVEEMMALFFAVTKKSCAKAKLTVLEKRTEVPNPWVIFSIECKKYEDGTGPESQVWHVIQGRDSLYSNQRALKVARIPEQKKKELVEFFKTTRLVYNE